MNPQDMAAQDRAAMEQTTPVYAQDIISAVYAADKWGNGHFGELYGHTRDCIVHFAAHYRTAAPSELDQTIAALCPPLLAYARALDAMHAQATVHGSEVSGNIADMHSQGRNVSGLFVKALSDADPDAYRPYLNFIMGKAPESAFNAELAQNLKDPTRRGVLIAAACCLKEGMASTHMAMSAGVRDVSELKPQSTRMREYARAIGGIHVAADGTAEDFSKPDEPEETP